jgi:hypothetical protein
MILILGRLIWPRVLAPRDGDHWCADDDVEGLPNVAMLIGHGVVQSYCFFVK